MSFLLYLIIQGEIFLLRCYKYHLQEINESINPLINKEQPIIELTLDG